jgi:uncharacterized protein with GYD domain
MPTYVVFGERTLQGYQNQTIRDMPQRRQARHEIADSLGISQRARVFTMGEFATVEIYEAPNDETIATYVLQLARRGNYSFRVERAYDESEWDDVIGRIGTIPGEGPAL